MQFDYLSLPKNIKQELDLFSKTKTVVVRFPPEPSGYLHLGHVKALSINYSIAKKYNGHIIIRMDDTNPRLESEEYEKSIIDDIIMLSVNYERLTYASDYFDDYIKYSEILIKSADAYVDLTDVSVMRHERKNAIDSKYRYATIDENIDLWNKMKSGELTTGCLRLRIDMNSKNKAMRDPAIFRPQIQRHHRTADKYKVYPMYDFSCPIVDYIEGITHVFRSSEFHDRDEMYVWILQKLKMPIPCLYHYGKINVNGAIMSKREIKRLISIGTYTGWDDPRLYTLRGMLNRGISYDALDILMKETGYPTSTIEVDCSTIWGINRKIIDKIASRYCAVSRDNIEIEIDLPDDFPDMKEIPKFVRNPSLGTRKVYYRDQMLFNTDDISRLEDGEEVTLMNLGNAIFKDNMFTSKLDGNPKTTRNRLIWIPKLHCINITIIDYIDDKPTMTEFVSEQSISEVQIGDFVQFMKMDYYKCKEITNDGIVFIRVP